MVNDRKALVIGNSAYPTEGAILKNARRDGESVAARLEDFGFDVTLVVDGTFKDMDDAIKQLRSDAPGCAAALFFFAGHGLQVDGENYLLGINSDTDHEDDVEFSSLSLKKVIKSLERTDAATKIIILDACRTNPFERRWRRAAPPEGLAPIAAPKGTIIAFATSPGEVALDGLGTNGAYTTALLEHIGAVDVPIEPMLKRVRNTLAASTGGKQTSWEHTSLSGDFYFNSGVAKQITEYGNIALADELFLIDPAKKSHALIGGLRSHTWNRQNAAVDLLSAGTVATMATDSLFVIGRNLYQAACGNSHSAMVLLRDFPNATAGWAPAKRKAVLDGMLFEVFFGADGGLRKAIKGEMFQDLFELERHAQFQESFAFIASALRTARARFPVIPGTGQELSVTINTTPGKTVPRVAAVYIAGVNYLRPTHAEFDVDESRQPFMSLPRGKLERTLSIELAVPERLLRLTFSPTESGNVAEIGWPAGWTVAP